MSVKRWTPTTIVQRFARKDKRNAHAVWPVVSGDNPNQDLP